MFLFEHFPVCTRITGQGDRGQGGGGGEEGGNRGRRAHRGEVREAREGVTRGREVEAGYGQISRGNTIKTIFIYIFGEILPIPDVLVSVGLLYSLVLGSPVLEPDLDLRL